MDKSLSLGMPMSPQGYIQEVQASKLGDAQGIPFFINKNIRSFFSTLYFYCFIYYVLFLERLCFSFHFTLVLFAIIIGWIPDLFVLERDMLHFHCIEHSGFIHIHLRVFSFY